MGKINKNWKNQVVKDTDLKNKDIDKTFIKDWDWDKLKVIFRRYWWSVLQHCKDNNLELRNIVAIMGKDTRKTTVWTIFLWFLMKEFPFLNGFMLRDTLDKATTQMKLQVRKSVELITNEYNVPKFNQKVFESVNDFYLVRDIKAKDNQNIGLLSFDKIVALGGFTTNNGQPAVFIYDELQNPSSANKTIINQKQFLANYKFIEKKNRGIEITTGNILPKWIPRHIFLSNRYVANHPLNIFAEEHFQYYDKAEDDKLVKGVRSWMLEDPLNNNFIAKYFGKEDMKEGWEDLWGTMIVYGGALSNDLLRLDKEWEDEQVALIKRGNPDDLAYIVGDLFEGYDNGDKAYHYSKKSKIDLDTFKNNYASYVNAVRISVDVDYSRQIVIGAKYDAEKIKLSPEYGNIKVWRTIRDKFVKIKCNGLSKDGKKTEIYIKQLYNEILKYCERINKLMPHIKKVIIIIDKDDLPGRFNFAEYANNYWIAQNASLKRLWKIKDRPAVIDTMQDTGFIIDIDHPSITELHNAYNTAKVKEVNEKGDKQRLEKMNNPLVDLWNTDEYGLYSAKSKMVFNNISTKKLGGKNEW